MKAFFALTEKAALISHAPHLQTKKTSTSSDPTNLLQSGAVQGHRLALKKWDLDERPRDCMLPLTIATE